MTRLLCEPIKPFIAFSDSLTRRYYVPDLPLSGGLCELPPEEAQHALRVMRIQVGDQIELFNGAGLQASASVESVDRRSCFVNAMPSVGIDRELATEIHMAVALPKPDRAKEMVERLTELGVQRLTPLVCQRSQRPPSSGLISKLKRNVIEACKQSGRNVVMGIEPVEPLEIFLERSGNGEKWIADPSGVIIDSQSHKTQVPVVVAIGPEGGFSDNELALSDQFGFRKFGLGPRIYRIETAACVAAVMFAE